MPAVFCIVEGHGEVEAVPILLRRLASEQLGLHTLTCLPPFRLPRSKLMNAVELSRAIALGRLKMKEMEGPHLILVIMDADDKCPVSVVQALHTQHQALFAVTRTSIVLAVREYEAWFLAANMSEADHRNLRAVTPVHANPEQVANPKAVFQRDFLKPGFTYSETVDQPRFTSCMSLASALRASSFDKLVREIRIAFIILKTAVGERTRARREGYFNSEVHQVAAGARRGGGLSTRPFRK
jgi:uncharacterized protein DUF4276